MLTLQLGKRVIDWVTETFFVVVVIVLEQSTCIYLEATLQLFGRPLVGHLNSLGQSECLPTK
jgi:hypothetical protein